MPLALSVDKIEDVVEPLRAAYVERDGRFYLDASVEDTTDLKKSIETERTKREAAEKLLTKASNELKKLENKEKADKVGLNDEQLKQLRADVRAEVEEEFAPFKADAEKFGKENRELKLDNAVKAIAGANGVRAERMAAWWKLNGDRFDLTEDGKPVVKDHPGKSIEKFVAEDLKAEVPDFYQGTQAAGGGSKGGLGIRNGVGDPKAAERVLSDPEGMLREANAKAAAA